MAKDGDIGEAMHEGENGGRIVRKTGENIKLFQGLIFCCLITELIIDSNF